MRTQDPDGRGRSYYMDDLAPWRASLVVSVAESTARHYVDYVDRLVQGRAASTIGEDDVVAYLATLTPGARWTAYYGLRSAFKWATRRGVVDADPTEHIPPPRLMKKEPRALSTEELAALRASAANRGPLDVVMIDFLYYTAARLGEAVAARWADVREDSVIIRGQKSQQERTVALHPTLAASLAAWREVRALEATQPSKVFGRVKVTLYKRFVRVAAEAGLPDVHPHIMRSTAATIMSERGASPTDIQRVLGHSDLAVTARYIASTSASRARSIGLL